MKRLRYLASGLLALALGVLGTTHLASSSSKKDYEEFPIVEREYKEQEEKPREINYKKNKMSKRNQEYQDISYQEPQSKKTNNVTIKTSEECTESQTLEEKISFYSNLATILEAEIKEVEPSPQNRYKELNIQNGRIRFGDKKINYVVYPTSWGIYLPTKNDGEVLIGAQFTPTDNCLMKFQVMKKGGELINIKSNYEEGAPLGYIAYETDDIFGSPKDNKTITLSQEEVRSFESFSYFLMENLKLSHPETFNR